jgi:hypothetical protein
MRKKKEPEEAYEVTLTSPDQLSAAEIATCIDVVAEGGAVSRAAAKAGVPQAATLALVRHKGEIIGVGVIKGPNPQHPRTVATESKHSFPETTPELGYASVRKTHLGKHLSSRIFETLFSAPTGPLYATTSDKKMKHLLGKHGFKKKGKTRKGRRGDALSLWLKGMTGQSAG